MNDYCVSRKGQNDDFYFPKGPPNWKCAVSEVCKFEKMKTFGKNNQKLSEETTWLIPQLREWI